jgi:prepilin-type N-terminal cleavage/methylation domain-containing protein
MNIMKSNKLSILKTLQIQAKIQCGKKSNQQGFTIIESLVAILVVSLLLAAIAPVLALSVANRVNTRRIELASQAARGYIDGVRGQVIAAPGTSTNLAQFPAPTTSGSLNCSANSYCTNTATSAIPTNLYCIDNDGDGNCTHTSARDLIVQAFRFNPSNPNPVATIGYSMGVRVYRASAFAKAGTLARSIDGAKQPSFNGTLGRPNIPLVEFTTEINEAEPKWSDICDRTNNGIATNAQGCN